MRKNGEKRNQKRARGEKKREKKNWEQIIEEREGGKEKI